MAGRPFFDVSISLDWAPSDLDIVWPTGPDTFAAFLGTATPPLARADVWFELRNDDYDSAGFSTVLTVDRRGRGGSDDGGRDDEVPVPAAVPSGRADAGVPWSATMSGALALLLVLVGTGARGRRSAPRGRPGPRC